MRLRREWLGLCVVAWLVAPGCDSSTAGNGDGSLPDDICGVNPFDPLCGKSCVSTSECGPNLHCGVEGFCRADCTPEGEECGEGFMCIAHGRCMEECASIEVQLDLVMPTVVLLIDQSGSMTQDFGGQSRWNAVKSALIDPTSGVVPALEDEILFGASLYTSHNGFSQGEECPLLQTVEPGLNNAVAIRTLLDNYAPDDDTPTGESITAVVDFLEALPPDQITSLRLIVLATDGEPDTCTNPDDNPQKGREVSIQGAQDAFDRGVRTVILSVGTDISNEHLQDMANAGAGLPVGGAENEPFYVANDPDDLVADFEAITQGVRSCIFALDGEVEPIEYAAQGEVRLNDNELPFEDPNGWRLLGPSTLELMGTACDTFLIDEDATLTARFPCGTVWVP